MIPFRADSPEETLPSDLEAAAPVKRRPVRRPSKPDAVLAAAVDFARQGLLEVVPAEQVGEHVTSYPEAERLTTHRFEAFVPGYGGWQWFVTLTRVPRGKEATISEVGLLPSEDALLAPEWLPWSERVRPEDHDAEAPTQAADGQPTQGQPTEGQPTEGQPAEGQPDDVPGQGDAGSADDEAAVAAQGSQDRDTAGSNSAGSEPAGPDSLAAGSSEADSAPAAPAPAESSPPVIRRKRARRVASAPAGDPFGNPSGASSPGRDD